MVASPSRCKPKTPRSCCLPTFRFKRKGHKRVLFSPNVNSDAATVTSSTNVTPNNALRRRRSVRRSASRRTWYSCVSDFGTPDDVKVTDTEISTNCICGHPAHVNYDQSFPLILAPNQNPNTYEEFLAHSKVIIGRWVVILDRSDSLDAQMTYMGIGKMKRMVMNRLATPFGAELVDGNQTLKCWIETPLGNKYTSSSLIGKELIDEDSDLGNWTSSTKMIDYTTQKFCNGSKPVRAMQQERKNSKLGVAYETKVVLPDAQEGRVLLYNITIHPPNGTPITADRIYKFMGPTA